jgi:hypothetical protein
MTDLPLGSEERGIAAKIACGDRMVLRGGNRSSPLAQRMIPCLQRLSLHGGEVP